MKEKINVVTIVMDRFTRPIKRYITGLDDLEYIYTQYPYADIWVKVSGRTLYCFNGRPLTRLWSELPIWDENRGIYTKYPDLPESPEGYEEEEDYLFEEETY